MRLRGAALLGLALVMASVSVVLAHAWLKDAARATADRPVASGPETSPVIVAGVDLGYGERLRAEHLRVVDWPKSSVPAGAFRAAGEVLGGAGGPQRTVLRAIQRDEPILSAKISGFGAPSTLAATIAPGLRATAIQVGAAGGMARFVRPGDRVDVLITRDSPDPQGGKALVAEVLIPDLRVLGLEPAAGAQRGTAGNGRSVTLEVTVAQAQRLLLAQKLGALSIALRGLDGAGTGHARRVFSDDLLAADRRIVPVGQAAHPDAGAGLARWVAEKLSPPSASVRVFRGLEASEYEVPPEGEALRPALRLLDAVKSGAAKSGAAKSGAVRP